MTLRHNPITQLPVISAPDRAGRPNAFGAAATVERCPFCPGHESDTPPELASVTDPDGRWIVRTFPNKYPAVAGHEVIVESPRHADSFDTVADPAAVVAHYVDRFADRSRASLFTSLFKNHGAAAGASLAHVHSQLMPLDFTPPRIEAELTGFSRQATCPLCAPLAGSSPVIAESEHFVCIAPEASTFAYQQWIVPRRHHSSIAELSAGEIEDLARQLARASRGMLRIANAYNWLFMNFAAHRSAHCYVEAFPRMTRVAGFELATGTFIDVIDPERAAQRYREIDASAD